MESKIKLLVIIFFFLSFHCMAREILTLKYSWKFSKGYHEKAFLKDFDDSGWQEVSIPHDWAISGPFDRNGDGSTGKLPWKGEAWYRKTLDIPEDYKNKQVFLVFDGIMAFPEIYINGKLAGKWDYGYNSFYFNITEFLEPGKKNVLAVHVDTRNHESRWYPGAGIYRKVQMIVTDDLHVGIWGTFVSTPIVKPHLAEIKINSYIHNNSLNNIDSLKIRQIIISPNGNEITSKELITRLISGKSTEIEMSIALNNPQRWDIEKPVLYQLKTIVMLGDEIKDIYFTSFGIRTIRFTADDGFYLNDRRIQLKGVNLHHDQGPLGAAFYKRAMERQLEIMKSMGCNAVRTSHNPPSPELLDLCDKMGILVFNELFDKYDKKADITDTTNFAQFAERNVRNFIIRDRNHPCVFIWSVGNEMRDVQINKNNGFSKLHTMVNLVKKYDPTRPVTMVCDNRESALLRHFDLYDIHCWNYGRRYDLARQLEPNKSVIISESASTVSTRGFYEFPLPEKKTDFTNSMQVSSYDLNAPIWAEVADDDLMWQQDENYIAGEFVWTGFDYLGEPTPYDSYTLKQMGMNQKEDSYSSYFGIVDLCGIPKDRFFLYRSYWNQNETTVHILPHWNWIGKEGQSIPVFVYTNGDYAELFLNGKSLGIKYKNPESQKSIERFRLMWNDVKYQAGEIKAIAYKEGVKIGESIIKTSEAPYQIKLSSDKQKISVGGEDLAYILIEALDKKGNPCYLADNLINIDVKGNGEIAGIGNGNPRSYEEFQGSQIKLFHGKALVIIKSQNIKGKAEVTANSKGLQKASQVIIIE